MQKMCRKETLLKIDVQTKHIYNLIETEKTKTTLTVNSFKTKHHLCPSFTFAADAYPNYYINT
jgi:hypothetical protein